MKNFYYQAKKGPEQLIEGYLSADSSDQAMDKIHAMGLTPIVLQEQKMRHMRDRRRGGFFPARRVKTKDLAQFYRQLGSLLRSGVPIVRALGFLARENSNPILRDVITGLESSVRGGAGLGSAFSKYPRIFSAFDRGMIQAGESSGKMEETMAAIALYRTEQEKLTNKVRSAMIYPLFIMGVGFASMIYMLTCVIPQFSGFFGQLGQDLPLPTRILLALSDGLRAGWWGIAIGGLIAGFLVKNYFKSTLNKAKWDAWTLRWPLAGALLTKSESARLARSLALMIQSGVPIIAALRGVMPVLTNAAFRKEIEKVSLKLEQGGGLSGALESTLLLPPFFIQIVSVGEEAGRLDEALLEISDWYERETAEAVDMMTGLLEPVMILIVGLILGAMMISVLLPIFNMSALVT
jgi:type II secretory pathway component PulF